MLADTLAPMGPVVPRRMFGGYGLFMDGLMFALIAGDHLYFKVDDQTLAAFQQEGLGPFTYQSKGQPRTLKSYYCSPEYLLDDPDEMVSWGNAAFGAARRAAK